MTILVFSDSHGAKNFMRACIEEYTPDYILHLGDHYEDGKKIAAEYPQIPMIQVPGNCDEYRDTEDAPLVRKIRLDGVSIFMTHGHLHGVKKNPYALVKDARDQGADIALFGHTHCALCRQEDDLWVMNPGSCGYFGATAGLIEIENGQISSCDILQ